MFARHRAFGIPPPVLTDSFDFTIDSFEVEWTLAARLGFMPSGPINVTIRVGPGVSVRSGSTLNFAMDLFGSVPAGSLVRLFNGGLIDGMGGDGGDGSTIQEQGTGLGLGESSGAHDGRDGGPSLRGPGPGIGFEINNGGGRIRGGGGGGGGGGSSVPTGSGNRQSAGGGGGGGAGGGKSGSGGKTASVIAADGIAGGTGLTGTFGTGGLGATSGGQGGTAGAGGDWGEDGTVGAGPTLAAEALQGLGGAGGIAIDQAGGTATIISGGSAPNLMGSVI